MPVGASVSQPKLGAVSTLPSSMPLKAGLLNLSGSVVTGIDTKSPKSALTAESPKPCARAKAARLFASGKGEAVVMTANWSPKLRVCKLESHATAVAAPGSFPSPSSPEAASSCRPELLSKSLINPANSFPFMGVDKLSSTAVAAAGAALDKGLAMVLVEKFRLLSMLFPCSLVFLPAANGWRGALY